MKIPFTPLLAWCLAVAALGATGCSDAINTASFARADLARIDYDTALTAAQQVMHSRFASVTVDPDASTVESRPTFFHQKDSLTGQNTYRRHARILLLRQEGRLWAFVQAPVERLDTSVYRQFHSSSGRADYDYPTPAESGDLASAQQRQVWTRVRRDHQLEKEIIDLLLSKLQISPHP